jgi:hypothetical protein
MLKYRIYKSIVIKYKDKNFNNNILKKILDDDLNNDDNNDNNEVGR